MQQKPCRISTILFTGYPQSYPHRIILAVAMESRFLIEMFILLVICSNTSNIDELQQKPCKIYGIE